MDFYPDPQPFTYTPPPPIAPTPMTIEKPLVLKNKNINTILSWTSISIIFILALVSLILVSIVFQTPSSLTQTEKDLLKVLVSTVEIKSNELTITSDLLVLGDTHLGQDLIVDGKMTINQNVTMQSDVVVDGNMTITKDVELKSNLSVDEQTTLKSDLLLNGNLQVNGDSVIEDLTLNNIIINGTFDVQGQFEVDNFIVNNHLNFKSLQETPGTQLITTEFPTNITLPSGSNGNGVTFSSILSKIIISSSSTALISTNGSVFTSLVTPFTSPSITWSPVLNLFTGIDAIGTTVHYSLNGTTWIAGTPLSGTTFNATHNPYWSTELNKFYIGTNSGSQSIATSTDGKSFTLISFVKDVTQFMYGTEINRLITIGTNGTGYSNDGINFISSNTLRFSSVAWSSFWKKFVAIPIDISLNAIVYESIDGISWSTPSQQLGTDFVNTITWMQDLGIFVVGGDNSGLWVSRDGLIWQQLFKTIASVNFQQGFYIEEWGEFLMTTNTTALATLPRRFT